MLLYEFLLLRKVNSIIFEVASSSRIIKKILLSKLSNLWYFVLAAVAN